MRIKNPHIRLLANIFGSVLSRSINLLTMALTVPLALGGLGAAEYATYATMLSFSIFFTFSDLGIGLSTVNPVASATGTSSIRKARLAISQAWGVQLVVGAAIALGGGLIAYLLAHTWFADPQTQKTALGWVAMLGAVGLGMTTGLGQRVMFSLGRNFEGNLWLIAGKALAVGAVFVAAHYNGGLLSFILATQLTPAIVSVILMVYLFGFNRRDLAPSPRFFRWSKAAKQIRTGLLFLLLSFSTFCEMGIDNILLNLVTDAPTVAQWDVTTKPLFYICSLSGIVLFPVWPHLSQQIAQGRPLPWHTARKIFASFGGIMVLIGLVLWLSLDFILHHWVGKDFIPLDQTTTFIVTLNTVFIAYGMLQSMLLNAKDKIKEQARVQIIFMIVLVPWKLLLATLWGPMGIALGLASAYIPRLLYVHFKLITPTFRNKG